MGNKIRLTNSFVARVTALLGLLVFAVGAMIVTSLVLSTSLNHRLNNIKTRDVTYNEKATNAYLGFLTMDDQSNMWLGLKNYGNKSLAQTTFQQIQQGEKQLNDSLSQLSQIAATPAEQAAVAKAQADAQKYEGYFAQIQQDYATNFKQASYIMFIGNSSASDALTKDLTNLVSDSQQIIQSRSDKALASSTNQRNVTWIVGLVVILLGAGILVFIRKMVAVIPRLSEELQEVAAGNLARQEIQMKRRDEIGMLAAAFNQMVKNLRELLGKVDESASHVAAASEEISAATEQIASASSAQAQSGENLSQLFKELNFAVAAVAKNAEEAAEIASLTADVAGNGQKIVESSVVGMTSVSEQMSRLSEDSNRVGEIVEVIDDIAEQTNLLALNAAIEAARAGEQGRGFAVVADEVRKLAERSGEATKQITTIIKTMQANTTAVVQAVSDGVVVSKKSGEAFHEIVGMVNQSADKVREIAAASEQQSAQASEVLSSVEHVAATAEEAAASSQETASASQSLAQIAQELNGYVTAFRVN